MGLEPGQVWRCRGGDLVEITQVGSAFIEVRSLSTGKRGNRFADGTVDMVWTPHPLDLIDFVQGLRRKA